MTGAKRRKQEQKRSGYHPQPTLPAQLEDRYGLVLAVLSGMLTMEQGAQRAGLSRPRFQTLVHRAQEAMIESLVPKPPGRVPRSAREAELEQQNQKLARQNQKLQNRVDTIDRLLGVASDMLQGRLEVSQPRGKRKRRQKRSAPASGEESDDPDPVQERLTGAQQMRQLGLKPQLAAAVVGAGASTVRRWAARARAGQRPRQRRGGPRRARPSAAACARVSAMVRELQGLVGAQSLSRSVPGVSRRQAAALKRQTLTELERERRQACTRVQVLVPGVLRGLDAMHPRGPQHAQYVLALADAAVCFRTSIQPRPVYDSATVAALLEQDIEQHGAPLVFRMDRASMHRTDQVGDVLSKHHVLLLHGPPHHAQYYGQLERQNREQRAWLDAADPDDDELPAACAAMKHALNAVWRRPTLGWQTAEEVWQKRPPLRIDRAELRDQVDHSKQRLRRHDAFREAADDVVARFAIEQQLTQLRLISQMPGGWR
jgi:transposase